MAKAISARQFGDEYQQLVFWKYALNLLSGNYEIDKIKYEDEAVKSYDDVVIEYAIPQKFRDTTINKEYIQVKFHMRDNNFFSLDNLLDPSFINATKYSLLDNVVLAFRSLGDEFKNCKFVIYSMWDIAQDDVLNELISNVDRTVILDKLFDGTTDASKMGKIRKKLCETLKLTTEELKCVLHQLCIMNRQETLVRLKEVINEKLSVLGLQVISGSKYTNQYSQLIQELNKLGNISFSKNFLEEQLRNENLYCIKKKSAIVAVRSFKKHTESLDDEANHILELEEYFEGRFLKNEFQWDKTIYPILKEYIERCFNDDKDYYIQLETNPSIAFTSGRILDIKAGKKIIPMQRGENGVASWEKMDNNKQYPEPISEELTFDNDCTDVAIIIGITRNIYNDVLEYFKEEKKEIGRIINITLETSDSASVSDGTHAWKLSNTIKNLIDTRNLSEKRNVLHLFAACPNSIMFILGRYSLSFGKIQLYEYDFSKLRTCTYYPTMKFPLKEEY